MVAVVARQGHYAVRRHFHMAVQSSTVSVADRIDRYDWTERSSAVVASGTRSLRSLRTIVDSIRIESGYICRSGERRVKRTAADRFMVKARSDSLAEGRYDPGLAVIVRIGSLVVARCQRKFSGEGATRIPVGESYRILINELRRRRRTIRPSGNLSVRWAVIIER